MSKKFMMSSLKKKTFVNLRPPTTRARHGQWPRWQQGQVGYAVPYKMANFHGVYLKFGHVDFAEFFIWYNEKCLSYCHKISEVIRRASALLPLSWNVQFCNEQTRPQPLFSPACASATYGIAQMCRRKNMFIEWHELLWSFEKHIFTHCGRVTLYNA